MTRREITVYDQATDTQTTVVVERDATRGPRIIEVNLAVRDKEGPGLSAEHLLMLEELGLPLPRGSHHDDDALSVPPIPEETTRHNGEHPLAFLPQVDALPVPEPRPAPTPAKKAAPTPVKKDTPKKPVKTRGSYRRRPAPAVLVTAYEKAKASPKAMATMFDVPVYTMQSWLRSARKDGILPLLDGKFATTKTEDGS